MLGLCVLTDEGEELCNCADKRDADGLATCLCVLVDGQEYRYGGEFERYVRASERLARCWAYEGKAAVNEFVT